MRSILTLSLLAALSTATAVTPAPLHGIWKLTGLTSHGHTIAVPESTLFISGTHVHGQLGCGSYQGTIKAERNAATFRVTPDAPAPTERCLYALPGKYHAALNAVTGYAITQDTKHLVLFSKTSRLTFERIGYVTPAKK